MSKMSNYLENQIGKLLLCTQTAWKPSAIYIALFKATKGLWAASTAYSSNDTICPTTANGRMYRCSTAGTSAATEPTWPTTDGGTVSDGTAVWTEMTPDFDAATNLNEVSGGSYARVGVTQADAQWNIPTTTGLFDNVNAITFASPTANWGTIGAFGIYDASASGNLLIHGVLTTPKTVNNGDAAPSIAAGALDITFA